MAQQRQQAGAPGAPSVRRTAALYALARFPVAAVWLSIVLDVSAASGSYAQAGLGVAFYGGGVALFAPLVGRVADRVGGRRVLLVCAAVQLPALTVLASLADDGGAALLLAAVVSGAVQPPLVPCMRASWSALVPDPVARKKCLSFDAVLGEAVDLVAPLLAVALHVLPSSTRSLPVVALASSGAIAVFALTTPLRAPSAQRAPRLGRVPARNVAVLLVIGVMTASLGAVEIGAVAVADSSGDRSAAGVLLAVFAATSIVGGLVHARRPPSRRPAVELAVLLLPLAVCLLAAAAVTSALPLVLVLVGVAGVVVAPLVSVLLGLVEATARAGSETSAFTWATSSNFVGVSLGSVVAGSVVDRAQASPTADAGAAALLTAGLFALLAMAVLPLLARTSVSGSRPPGSWPWPDADELAQRRALLDELDDLLAQARAVEADNDRLSRALVELRTARPAGPTAVAAPPLAGLPRQGQRAPLPAHAPTSATRAPVPSSPPEG